MERRMELDYGGTIISAAWAGDKLQVVFRMKGSPRIQVRLYSDFVFYMIISDNLG